MRLGARRSARWALAAVSAAAIAVRPAPVATQIVLTGQAPTFKSGVELIAIDVSVVDKSGNPVRGLGTDRFDVTVDGKPRRVVSAELVDHVPPAGAAAERRDAVRPTYSTNDGAGGATPIAPGRLLFLVVDEGSFRPAAARGATAAARRFVARLQPADRVGLITFPAPGKVIAPSKNHDAVLDALPRIVGSAESVVGSGNWSVGLSEAVAIEGGGSFAFDSVSARECRGLSDRDLQSCRDSLRAEAHDIATLAQFQARRTLSGLSAVVRSLAAVKERKTVVVISAGMPQADGPGGLDTQAEIAAIARQAAGINATIYVLHVDVASLEGNSASQARPSEATRGDAAALGTGLETLAGASGGTLFRVVAGVDFAFDRVLQETAATYVLALEPADGDRDGKPHALKVAVKLPGALVRNRREFVLPANAPAAEISTDPLTVALVGPRAATGLVMGVATHVLGRADAGNFRVLITANVGRGLSDGFEARVGYRVADSEGRLVATNDERKRLRVSRISADGAASYASIVLLPAGAYNLRIAALDAGGRAGSVDHPFAVGMQAAGGVALGDLLLLEPVRQSEEDLLPIADGRMRGPEFSAYLELYPDSAVMPPADVTIGLSERADGPPLVRAKAAGPPPDPLGHSVVGVRLDVSLVPPGDYLAVAVVSSGSKVLARRTQPLRIEAAASGANASNGSAAPRVRFALGASAGLVRPFTRADVLAPAALEFFAGRLKAADRQAAATPAATDAATALRGGKFDEALVVLSAAPADRLSIVFLKGLALLGKGALEPAARQFREALRIADDFLPAAFYLGACYAAGGHDSEAIGAWQTALVTEDDARIVYDVLTDALLREGEAERAVEIVAEARGRWTDDSAFLPRLAVAQAMLGHGAQALATLGEYLQLHQADTEAAALAVRLIYEAHAANRTLVSQAGDRELAEKYAAWYRAGGGANEALVNRWVAFILKSGSSGAEP